MAEYDVSIDPGVTATGYCVWQDGEPVETGALRPKGATFLDKCRWLDEELTMLFSAIATMGSNISRVAIEEFEPRNRRDGDPKKDIGKASMIKCATARGICIGVAFEWTTDVSLVSKQRIRKTQTALMAQAQGKKLQGGKDALDAWQIGICAGFDRR